VIIQGLGADQFSVSGTLVIPLLSIVIIDFNHFDYLRTERDYLGGYITTTLRRSGRADTKN